jgi:hypothetical protein
MQVTTRTRRLLLVPLPAVAVAAALALWAPGSGNAIGNPDGGPVKFSLVGLVEGQTLRLSAANVALGDRERGPCRTSLGFADLDGRAIIAHERAELAPGQGTFVDLRAVQIDDPALREGGRAEVRPVALGGPDTKSCKLAFSAQVFGPVGNMTEVYIGNPDGS